jgi:hypothetical protein
VKNPRENPALICPVRPLPCIVIPEYRVNEGIFAAQAQKAHFKDDLGLQSPFFLSPDGAKAVAKLWRRNKNKNHKNHCLSWVVKVI